MAINIDPKCLRKITLDKNRNGKPRTIMAFHKTCRETDRFDVVYKEWLEWIDEKGKPSKEDGDAIISEMISCIDDQIHKWQNITRPRTGEKVRFKKGLIEDMFTPAEVMEIFRNLYFAEILETEDAKKSKLQSPTPSAKSAKRARRKK